MYDVKVGFRKYKNVKGYQFIGNTQTIVLIFKDEKRIMIPTNKYIIEFSSGWFKEIKNKIKKETSGQVNI